MNTSKLYRDIAEFLIESEIDPQDVDLPQILATMRKMKDELAEKQASERHTELLKAINANRSAMVTTINRQTDAINAFRSRLDELIGTFEQHLNGSAFAQSFVLSLFEKIGEKLGIDTETVIAEVEAQIVAAMNRDYEDDDDNTVESDRVEQDENSQERGSPVYEPTDEEVNEQPGAGAPATQENAVT